jgi:dihydropteroate synthase
MIHNKLTINCKGKLLGLHQPIVMGVLNVTPDSFYDGGQYQQVDTILRQAEKMLTEGASIIDVGGMSSRPGAEIISEKEELHRVIPTIEHLAKHFPEAIISVDTLRANVAKQAVEAGASIVNDISASSLDAEMYATVAALGVPYVLMHMRGTPKTMQQNIDYQDVTQEVLSFLIQEVGKLRTLGVKDILLDIGFGFGKTVEQNYELLKKMHLFKMLDLPILVGISRKSMIYKVLQTSPKDALNGTSALHIVALQQGAKILRVHDVKEAMQVIQLWQQLEKVGA